MNVKLTWFFEGVQAALRYASASVGWTESWYASSNEFSSIDRWFESLDVLNYTALRIATLPAIYRIAWLRVSDEANPRSYKVVAIPDGYGTALPVLGASAGTQALGQVQCAVLVDLARLPDDNTDHTHHRRFLMRALPSDVISGNVINTGVQNWVPIKLFLNWLAIKETGNPLPGVLPLGVDPNGTIGLRYQDPTAAAYTASPAVVNSPNSPRDIDVATQLVGTPGVTDYVFRDFPDHVRAINRTWRLLSATAGPPASSTLGRTRRDLPTLNYTGAGPGRFRRVVQKYGLFNQYTVIGLRSKKTGRLFRQLRGRSSNR